jgi:hypothetical protein
MTIPQLKDIRTDGGEPIRSSAAAVVGEGGEIMTDHQFEVTPDGIQARRVVGAEPTCVPVRATRDARSVGVGVESEGLGTSSGSVELRLRGRRTAVKGGPLAIDTGDGEVTGELDHSNILNGGIQVLGGAVNIDVGEEARWHDGVVSSARSSEVVRSGD